MVPTRGADAQILERPNVVMIAVRWCADDASCGRNAGLLNTNAPTVQQDDTCPERAGLVSTPVNIDV